MRSAHLLVSAGMNFGKANILVSRTIVKETTTALFHHALHKYYVGNLADLFPFLFWRKDGFVRSPDELARILAGEYGNSSAIDEMIVGSIVDEYNAVFRENWWWTGLYYTGIEPPGTPRDYGDLCRIRPVDKVRRLSQSHLIVLVCTGAQKIHPVFAIYLLRHDRPRFCPADVPMSFVGRQNHALALPVD